MSKHLHQFSLDPERFYNVISEQPKGHVGLNSKTEEEAKRKRSIGLYLRLAVVHHIVAN